jgi:hypothetical protein
MSFNKLKVVELHIPSRAAASVVAEAGLTKVFIDTDGVLKARTENGNIVEVISGNLSFEKTLAATAGNGNVGALTLTTIPILPSGYAVTEFGYNVKTALTSGGSAILNVGIATQDTDAFIDDTAGALATINAAPVKKTFITTPVLATAARNIVAEVKGAAFTGGVIKCFFKIEKLS